jgi:hypothetical protein
MIRELVLRDVARYLHWRGTRYDIWSDRKLQLDTDLTEMRLSNPEQKIILASVKAKLDSKYNDIKYEDTQRHTI